MPWSPDRDVLRGRVAVVAGATRGAGRGIAGALGEAGATVVCTGRSSSKRPIPSDYNRAETIEETAELVTNLGGTGIAAAVDHLDPDQVKAPRYVGRAVAALAADPERARWHQKSVSSAQLAREYGFTDLDGSQPDIWRYIEEVRERGLQADLSDYR